MSLKSETKSEASTIERFVSTECNQLLLQLHTTLPTYDYSLRNLYNKIKISFTRASDHSSIHSHPTCLEFLEYLTSLFNGFKNVWYQDKDRLTSRRKSISIISELISNMSVRKRLANIKLLANELKKQRVQNHN